MSLSGHLCMAMLMACTIHLGQKTPGLMHLMKQTIFVHHLLSEQLPVTVQQLLSRMKTSLNPDHTQCGPVLTLAQSSQRISISMQYSSGLRQEKDHLKKKWTGQIDIGGLYGVNTIGYFCRRRCCTSDGLMKGLDMRACRYVSQTS